MKEYIFSNLTKYNKDCVKNDINYFSHIINLSSMLFTFPVSKKEKCLEVFDIHSIFNYHECVKTDRIGPKKYIGIIHPDILELSKEFGYTLTDYEINNKVINFKSEMASIAEVSDIMNNIAYMFKEIIKFIQTRDKIINFKTLGNISTYDEEFNEELIDILEKIIEREEEATLKFNDIFMHAGLYYDKRSYELYTSAVYNYQTLSNLLKKLILSDSEYYTSKWLKDYEERKEKLENTEEKTSHTFNEIKFIKKNIAKENEILDYINNSPVFKKETLAILYVRLEEYVKKEKAIENFVNKILSGQLKMRVNI